MLLCIPMVCAFVIVVFVIHGAFSCKSLHWTGAHGYAFAAWSCCYLYIYCWHNVIVVVLLFIQVVSMVACIAGKF